MKYVLKSIFALLAFLLGVTIMHTAFLSGENSSTKPFPEIDVGEDWQLALQASTFRPYTFFETIDKTADLGLQWIEAFRKQPLSDEWSEVTFSTLPSANRSEILDEVKQQLRSRGVTLINYGVVPLPKDEAACREVFDFARDMGIKTIVSAPPPEALDLVERLCKEYQIQMAIHNHPRPESQSGPGYWNPEKVVQVCQGRSKWIGACGDTGHWMRSGIEPVEALRVLEGRVLSLHLKDLNAFGVREAHDVPWGTGKADIPGILTELKRQGFQGVIAIEYEHRSENAYQEILRSIGYYQGLVGALQSRH